MKKKNKSKKNRKFFIPVMYIFSISFVNLGLIALPAIILLFLSILIKTPLHNTVTLFNWAFVIATIYAVFIHRFIKLKIDYQKDYSDSLFVGAKLFTILLILSIINLVVIKNIKEIR